MGCMYQSRWEITNDISIDYLINLSNQSKGMNAIWVDLTQALKILAEDGRTVTTINKIWSVNNSPYCPVLDFIQQTGIKTEKKSMLFKKIIESLITLALVPRVDIADDDPNLLQLSEIDETLTFEQKDDKKSNFLMSFTDFSELERIAEVDEDAAADQYHDKSGKYIAERGQEGESGKVDESSAADDIKNERQSLPPPPSNSDRRSKRVRKKRKRKDFLEDFQDTEEEFVPDVIKDEDANLTAEDLNDSNEDVDGLPGDSDEPLISCELCPSTLRGNVSLYSHYRSQHPDQPDKLPSRPNGKLSECDECAQVFSLKRELKQHMRSSHPEKVAEESNCPYPCNGCSKKFKTKGGLYRHCVEHHPGDQQIWPVKEYKGPNTTKLTDLHERSELRCGLPECGHVFTLLKGLVRHERNHQEAFICVLCGKPCYSAEALIDHCENEHSAKSRYLCRICGFFNSTESGLQLHTVQIHMKGTKEYSCEHCEYKTNNRSTFQNHVRVHLRGTHDYVCEECGKSFATPQAISTHKLTHKSRDSFQYQCSYCPKRFPHVSLLKIHERVHTGEKPFQCKDCGQCFGSQSSLIKHNRNMHTPSSEMPYKCEECGKTFSKARRKVYLGHLKQHSGIRDHSCPLCKAAFSSRSYLCNHFKKVHRKKLADVEGGLSKEPLILEAPDQFAFTIRSVKGYLDV